MRGPDRGRAGPRRLLVADRAPERRLRSWPRWRGAAPSRRWWARSPPAAVWDDSGGGRLWFRRAVLPHRTTWNVVAEAGDREAERTLVFISHHDAAH